MKTKLMLLCLVLGFTGLKSQATNKNPEDILVESSGVVLLGDQLVIEGDENGDSMWVSDTLTDDISVASLRKSRSHNFDDIEGLAKWGSDPSQFVVMTSQSRTKKGNRKPEREQLAFAQLVNKGKKNEVEILSSTPIRDTLIPHLQKNLQDAVSDLDAIKEEIPDDGGLNIEGISQWNQKLYLGLRTPTAKSGGAILVAISNAREVSEGADPIYDTPLMIDARKCIGVRDMTATSKGILILLGPSDGCDGSFSLELWNPDTDEVRVVNSDKFATLRRPEGIALDEKRGILYVVQDFKEGANHGQSPLIKIRLSDF